MSVFYRSCDISTQPTFVKPVEMQLLWSDDPCIPAFEYGAGLDHGEFQTETHCIENYVKVQPRLLPWHGFAFVPVDSVLEEIYAMFEYNFSHPQHTRIRFHCLQSLRDTPYTFEMSGNFRNPLFTRHPITGCIAKHTYPYPKLPLFKMTAHPCLALFRAFCLYTRLSHPCVPWPLLTAIERGLVRWRHTIPESYFRPTVSPTASDCPSLVPSTGTSSEEEEEEEEEEEIPEFESRAATWVQESNESPMDVDVASDAISKTTAIGYRFDLDNGEWMREDAGMVRLGLEVKAMPARETPRTRAVRPSRLPRPVRTTRRTTRRS
ncbi:hypothetical protein CYLTODRAFT_446901 [Cylindrobasidium torrendii FP15055 ss-10]|uniref:Uncharacterized protein n=1 Tax=Cylindrobasidium torrendii FP15055 ss-10 TaxID=1314674 RepID=A0A0D7AX72_9AGAR|nr:hypothetical protein CYLTODRAFT_446901 [Cylindrobasidium torrendii FP15055 ss-10]